MKDTKGFTLVELLAVIVILAVVMLLATTAVGPLMDKSRKGALGSEGLALVDAAKMAYQIELMNGGISSSTSSVCFSVAWLNRNQYYDKGSNDNYTGSVLVAYDTNTGGYTYTFWISNKSYVYTAQNPTTYASDNAKAGETANSECEGKASINKTT